MLNVWGMVTRGTNDVGVQGPDEAVDTYTATGVSCDMRGRTLGARFRGPVWDADRGRKMTMHVSRSTTGYADTRRRLLEGIETRGLPVFARIDHAAGAREAGLELAPEEVVLFGNPQAGTPLMQRDPRIGVELPLRMLVWEDADGAAVGYNDPLDLVARYDVEPNRATLEAMSRLLATLASEAAEGAQ